MTLPDWARRALRTFLQSAIGMFLALVVSGNVTQQVPAFGVIKAAVIAAAWAGFIAVLSAAQNALEERSGRALLPK